jgi:hypothetical protein
MSTKTFQQSERLSSRSLTTQVLFPGTSSEFHPADTVSTASATGVYSASRTGSNVQYFRQIISQHENATGNLIGIQRRITRSPASLRRVNTFYRQGGSEWIVELRTKQFTDGDILAFGNTDADYFPLNVGSGDPGVANVALSKFYSECRRSTRTLMGGVVIGEIRETVRQIEHPASAIRNLLRSYLGDVKRRTRGLKGYRSVSKAVAGSWLELQFGWKPLLSDLDHAAQALAELSGRPKYQRVSGSAKSDAIISVTTSVGTLNGSQVQVNRRTTETTSSRYYGEVRVDNSGGISQAVQSFGLGVSDFLPTVYELIPYSFVVDYFSNLGTVIDAMTFLNSNISWVSNTKRISRFRDIGGSCLPGSSSGATIITQSGSPGTIHMEETSINRTAIDPSQLGMPHLTFQIPGVGKKWLNLAALVAQGRSIERSFRL